MNRLNGHLDVETLSAFVDGDLQTLEADGVARHVDACDACRTSAGRVRALVSAAGALPRDVAPPPAAWAGVRRQHSERRAGRRTRRWWGTGLLAVAATLLLWVGMNVFPPGAAKAKAAKLRGAPAAVPAVAAVDRSYEPTLAELRAAFETQREALAPATVRTLEHSLAIIDTAIAEARAALAADPGRQALMDLLAAHYARKVEFLKRATTLSSTM